MRALPLFSLLLVACFSFAVEVEVLAPVHKIATSNSEIDLGVVGPGQTVFIQVEPRATKGGKFGQGGRWDDMRVEDLPAGWETIPSKTYAIPLQAQITVPQNASDGEYTARVRVIDEGGAEMLSPTGDVPIKVKIHVSREVLEMNVEPREQKTGAGQPARYIITIKNKGVADDTFEVSSSGVEGWSFRKALYVPSGGSKQIIYEVAGNEEETYTVMISVKSTSSDLIKKSEEVKLFVETNLISDYSATVRGLLIFPIIEAPIYSFMGLISNLFG